MGKTGLKAQCLDYGGTEFYALFGFFAFHIPQGDGLRTDPLFTARHQDIGAIPRDVAVQNFAIGTDGIKSELFALDVFLYTYLTHTADQGQNFLEMRGVVYPVGIGGTRTGKPEKVRVIGL